MSSFFTWHIFLEVGKHKICQVNFGKLLAYPIAQQNIFYQNIP
jgi:hypothetical protein